MLVGSNFRYIAALAWVLAACGASPVPEATTADLAAARTFAPEISVAELNSGRELFLERCSSCHRLPEPHAFPVARWESLVGEMRDVAKLTDQQERQVVAYLRVAAQR